MKETILKYLVYLELRSLEDSLKHFDTTREIKETVLKYLVYF